MNRGTDTGTGFSEGWSGGGSSPQKALLVQLNESRQSGEGGERPRRRGRDGGQCWLCGQHWVCEDDLASQELRAQLPACSCPLFFCRLGSGAPCHACSPHPCPRPGVCTVQVPRRRLCGPQLSRAAVETPVGFQTRIMMPRKFIKRYILIKGVLFLNHSWSLTTAAH